MSHIKKMLFLLPIAMVLVGLLTAIMTAISILPEQAFIPTWFNAFVFAFLVMLPLGGGIFYCVDKLVKGIFPSLSAVQSNLLHGLLMAVLMESILAIITTFNSQGFPSFIVFLKQASLSLLAALPVGITMACVMSLVVKPKLEQHLSASRTS